MQTSIKRYNILLRGNVQHRDYLDGIKIDTEEMKGSLTKIITTLETFAIKQDGHNQRLEKTLEKLTEK